ncbi:hypothetical protein RCOM_0082560 [Ricinus communis]|uniref:Uncharacterized protein n=1 Tax=Ricinus communis TaxID=3988 RepID=B9T2U9_RICCO|nr:hypothetical protein RCOM_0082560 [Ricinus communis]
MNKLRTEIGALTRFRAVEEKRDHRNQPRFVVFVMASSIRRLAAFDQVQAFKKSFPNGAVVLTKMDVHATAFGALAAEDNLRMILRTLALNPFVHRLLGLDDSVKFYNKRQERLNSLYEGTLDQEKSKRFKTILGRMRVEGLDVYDPNLLSSSCIMKIAEGSGYQVGEVEEAYKHAARSFELVHKPIYS